YEVGRGLDGQARLSDAAHTRKRYEPVRLQQLPRCPQVVLAADEARQSRGQVVVRTLPWQPRRRVEARVLDQHRLLEGSKRRRRLDAELLGQGVAGVLERAQRLGLPSAPVQREHELLPAVLAQWLRFDRPSQRVDDQLVTAQRELYVRPQFV